MFDIDKLCDALLNGDRAAIDKHLVQGGDYNQLNSKNKSALYAACAAEDSASVEKILRYGADPNNSGPDRIAPLLCVLQSAPIGQCPELDECTKIIDLLLEADANIDVTSFDGRTVLMVAQHSDHIKKLLKRVPFINVSDFNNKTALHYHLEAYECYKDALPKFDDIGYQHKQDILKSISYLIKAGAEISLTNQNGDSCLDIAMKSGDKALQDIFLAAVDEKNAKASAEFREKAQKQETQERNQAMKRIFAKNKAINPKRRR